MTQKNTISPDCKCCANCMLFEERTGFCRANPPTVVSQLIKAVGQITTAVWPKIPLPNIDWCGKFKHRQQLI